jgi:hypothetical protein
MDIIKYHYKDFIPIIGLVNYGKRTSKIRLEDKLPDNCIQPTEITLLEEDYLGLKKVLNHNNISISQPSLRNELKEIRYLENYHKNLLKIARNTEFKRISLAFVNSAYIIGGVSLINNFENIKNYSINLLDKIF